MHNHVIMFNILFARPRYSNTLAQIIKENYRSQLRPAIIICALFTSIHELHPACVCSITTRVQGATKRAHLEAAEKFAQVARVCLGSSFSYAHGEREHALARHISRTRTVRMFLARRVFTDDGIRGGGGACTHRMCTHFRMARGARDASSKTNERSVNEIINMSVEKPTFIQTSERTEQRAWELARSAYI